jgi:hypothetical protein
MARNTARSKPRKAARTSTARTRKAGASAARRPKSRAGSRARRASTAKPPRRWSQRVTQESDALDLKSGVFSLNDPRKIAASLKQSAERSKRRKSDPFRSAMSMLTFYINRAGKNLPATRRKTLMRAKDELRHQFGRD